MVKLLKILLVTENESLSKNITKLLLNSVPPKFVIITVGSLKDAIEIMLNKQIEIVFFDFTKIENIKFDSLKTISLGYPHIPLIVIVNKDMKIQIVKNVIKNGAQEIIMYKNIDKEMIEKHIEFAVERKKKESTLVQAKKEMEQNSIDFKNALFEIKHLMKEVERKNIELKELNKLKSNFVSIVSHELRTPLTYIKESIAQVLEGLHGEINEDQREFLNISIEGMDRLSEIVNNLLDISKIEAGKIKLKKKFVDIGEIIKHEITGFKGIYKKKNLSLDIILPEENIILFIDSEKIVQVLNNLLSNAFKFTIEGGVTVKVKKDEKEVRVSVIDTGIGVSKQNIDKIFDTFVQISRKYGPGIKGTGLGLGIVKKLIELHDGTVDFRSELNMGSNVTFALPILSKQLIINECIESFIQEANNNDASFSIIILSLMKMDSNLLSKNNLDQNIISNTVKEIMENCLKRNTDQIFRFIENECIILLPDTDKNGVLALKHRFGDKLRSYMDTFETNYRIDLPIKFGFAEFPVHASTGKELIGTARNNMKKLYTGSERRKAKRHPVDVLIKGINDKGEYIELKTVNISYGGVCISTSKYIEIPEYNHITIYLPENFGTINATANVSWTKNNETKDEFQIGLRFQEISDTDKTILKRFIEYHNEKAF